ncbi:hypothetical protein [Absicoccus intestinalis]|uniref:ATP-binding protein n=1 Tax=Absicoccus intestinalis TaxID=2926319 RepID=A0ABU4WIP9_9FIRM|nr:hypothetical protein [Absicoccus sp. CLA-KB-P134]MDX8416436.1 ATP-binding protein [Absicoccus sp. CLA-KB-P134]
MKLDTCNPMGDIAKFLDMIGKLSKVDLLILDDFELMEMDVDKCRFVFEILDAWENRKSTIVVYQIPVKDGMICSCNQPMQTHDMIDYCSKHTVYNLMVNH